MRRTALVTLLALSASACTIAVDIGISLDSDGTGRLAVDIETDDEFQDLYRLTGRDFEDLVASRGATGGLIFTVTPGAVTRYSAESATVPAETIESLLEGLVPGIGDVIIAREDGTLELDAQLNPLTSLDDVAPYFVDSDPGQFADDVEVEVTVTMAGELDASTATNLQDGRLNWTIPFSDSTTRVFARTIVGEEGSRIPWTLAILAGTLTLAVFFLIAIRSSLAGSDEAAPGPLRSIPSQPESTPPEDQPISADSTPPEDQPVAPPPDMVEPG